MSELSSSKRPSIITDVPQWEIEGANVGYASSTDVGDGALKVYSLASVPIGANINVGLDPVSAVFSVITVPAMLVI
jgi:hypothetical protein